PSATALTRTKATNRRFISTCRGWPIQTENSEGNVLTSIKITNARCEAACVYCYENALRDAGDEASDRPLDLQAVMAQMEREYYPGATPPYVHGGEALLAGHDTVETLMRKAYDCARTTNNQTNG